MKRNMFCLFLCVLLLIPFPARAAVSCVVDQADLLTEQETIYLDNRAAEISSAYGVDVLIATVKTLDGELAGDYAATLNGSRAWWDTDDAILFLLAMEEREWYIATFGTAISVFSDAALDSLGSTAAVSFSSGNYYQGFSDYLSGAENFLLSSPSDDPSASYISSHEPEGKSFVSVLPLSLLIGASVATAALLIMRSAMNTKRRQHGAGDYMNPGSYHLRTHQDFFLYSNVTKTRRQQNTGSSGGGTIHRSSGGRSHGGRGGKF